MFGLMRAKQCGQTPQERDERRLNYCGTCKTLGAAYGQKSRLLLDHDTVFLAELLTALSGESLNQDPALGSYNCLRLPHGGEAPLALRFAATANVVLAEFKTNDQLADSNGFAARIVKRIFNRSFRKAEKQLKTWRFPLAELQSLPPLQAAREAAAGGQTSASPAETAAGLAEPTARATGLFFDYGARLLNLETAAAMRRLGFVFGEIVYLLDALEDYEKDWRRGEFNALRAAFGLDEARLPNRVKRKTETLLLAKADEAAGILRSLPMAPAKAEIFVRRLNDNLNRHFKKSLPVTRTVCRPPRQTVRARWQTARRQSRDLFAESALAPDRLQIPFAFGIVFLVAFFAPQQAREAKSWRECSELGFNLMFLGAAFGAAAAIGKQSLINLSPNKILTDDEERKKHRLSWCDGCYCENCCPDCCCESCGCGDNCDCCCCND